MERHKYAMFLLAALLAVSGCGMKNAPIGIHGNRTTSSISQAEIEACGASNVYEAVSVLRPRWLRTRVSTGAAVGMDESPALYVHGSRFGSAHDLHQFHIADIGRVRYVPALDATIHWGPGHTNGVIEVILLRSLGNPRSGRQFAL